MLQAAAHVLVTEGYERTTTARVALRAGVSVGSVYQYFPNKEAMVAALIERHAEEIVTITEQAVRQSKGRNLDEALRAIIKAGIDAHRVSPPLHKILVEQVPRVGRIAEAMDTSRRLSELIEQVLRERKDELAPGCQPSLAALVLETALEAVAHKIVIQRPELLEDEVIEREMFALASGYLRPR